MSEYRISDVAARTGFSPSALRYYERIGLIPEPSRTAQGYRVFTDRHLDILGFIARAKRLGLPLDEVRALAEAWATGDCRATRGQMVDLVGAKLSALRHLIGDLIAFRDQLEHVHAGLSAEPVPVRCGPECGCDIEVGRADLETARELTLASLSPRAAKAS